MSSLIQKKLDTLRKDLLGNNTDAVVVKRIECSEEENKMYEELKFGDYSRPLPDEVFEDADHRGKYYKKVTEHISFDPPTESEINEYLKLTRLRYAKESAEHLRVIRTILVWSAFIVALFAGLSCCGAVILYAIGENYTGALIFVCPAIVLFCIAGAAFKYRATADVEENRDFN